MISKGGFMAKILVIDDSNTLRSLLKSILLKNQFEVEEALNGLEALMYLDKNEDIDFIFCDLYMPKMGGEDFCVKYFQDRRFRKVPVVICSTDAGMDIKAKFSDLGTSAWITKPFKEDDIMKCLKKLLK